MNNSRLKFRAWDGADMIYFDLALCNKESTAWFDNTVWRNPVMQFTGLTDVNGVDIYEGDVIEDEEHFYSVVVWNEKCLSWFADGEHLGDYDSSMIKVIGNIHQHPHLLEPTQ